MRNRIFYFFILIDSTLLALLKAAEAGDCHLLAEINRHNWKHWLEAFITSKKITKPPWNFISEVKTIY